MSKLKLNGERVALIELDEEISGTIVVPQSRQKAYELGKIVAVGSGKVPSIEKPFDMYVKEGEIVLFSIPAQLRQSSTYVIDGARTCVVHQNDVLGRLSSMKVSIDTFEILGRWVLLTCFVDKKDSIIEIPDTAQLPVEDFKFRIEQVGSGASELNMVKGDEVVVERTRCSTLEIDGSKYFYIDMSFVYGKVEPAVATEQTVDQE